MSILGDIERLINEHGSAAILRERLALAKDEHAALEKRVATLEKQNAELAGQNQRLELDNYKLKEKIGNLEKELGQVQGKELDEHSAKIIALLAQARERQSLTWIADCLGLHATK